MTSGRRPRFGPLRSPVETSRGCGRWPSCWWSSGMPGCSALTGGYVGVDVFFVISGFLITSLLLREATGTGALSLVGFYARRARRILPAATVTLVVTAVAATALLPYMRAAVDPARTSPGRPCSPSTSTSARRGPTTSRPTLPPSPVQHFWSLSVEEQFYLVWPALIIVVLILGARRSRTAVGRRLPRLALLVAGLCAASLAWSIYATRTQPDRRILLHVHPRLGAGRRRAAGLRRHIRSGG